MRALLIAAFMLLIPLSLQAAEFRGETSEADFNAYLLSRGKPVLVFYWASWSPPSRRMINELEAIRQKYHEPVLHMIGINFDEKPEDGLALMESSMPGLPSFRANRSMRRVISSNFLPSIQLYDPKGVMALQIAGWQSSKHILTRMDPLMLPWLPAPK